MAGDRTPWGIKQILPEDVTLVAVSKTKPADDIIAAYKHGQRQFGESYVQEAVTKVTALADYKDIIWHFIGPIQSNKTKLISQHFDWVQSVDREKIAQRLNDQRPKGLPALNVCIQVNINDEESKSGLNIQEVETIAQLIHRLPHLTLRGLMTIPKAAQSPEELDASFLAMSALFKQLQVQYPSMDTLSMGMSGDIESAIRNGATLVRVGTALFGQRL